MRKISLLFLLSIFTFALNIDVPKDLYAGELIALKLDFTKPVKKVEINWLGKSKTIRYSEAKMSHNVYIAVPLPNPKPTFALSIKANSKTKKVQIKPKYKEYEKQYIKVSKKYVAPDVEVLDRIKAEKEATGAAFHTINFNIGDAKFYEPLNGRISSIFGLERIYNNAVGKNVRKKYHLGLDIAMPQGAEVKAIADGIVRISDNYYYAGNVVYIEHGSGIVSVYMHLYQSHLKKGDKIKAGDKIGEVGTTGMSTGPHLHLGVYIHGVAIDPSQLLLGSKI